MVCIIKSSLKKTLISSIYAKTVCLIVSEIFGKIHLNISEIPTLRLGSLQHAELPIKKKTLFRNRRLSQISSKLVIDTFVFN